MSPKGQDQKAVVVTGYRHREMVVDPFVQVV